MQVLACHIIPATVKAADLIPGGSLNTMGGCRVAIQETDAGAAPAFSAANGGTTAAVVTADVMPCGSTVHVIDAVLLEGDDAPDPGSVDGSRACCANGTFCCSGPCVPIEAPLAASANCFASGCCAPREDDRDE